MPTKYSGAPKGGFYKESTDAFVISSNRKTLLFSWDWILNLRYFKGLKSNQIRAGKAQIWKWSLIWAFRATSCTLIYHNFKIQTQENNKVCLFEEVTNAPVPSK